MNFLLILTIIESIILGLAVTISFFFSKKLVAAEFNKLIKKVDNNFDKIITLVSGIVLSALIAMALTKCADIFLGRLLNGHEMICESYFRLIVFWVILLTSNYAIVAPAHSKLRILQISDKEAQIIYGKFFRIIWLSFLITVLVSLLMIYAEKFKQIWGYLGAALMATYLFLEMLNSQKFIDRSLAIANPRKSFISFKLTTFISQKITFLCLIGMYGIIFTTRASANMFFFNSLECIYCILVAIFS
ncbi:MAG: hypothetical protein LBQ08_05155, partial [Holosporaceae bacterium]|nr:hypothetical protein [Holosporaceae bacterium]